MSSNQQIKSNIWKYYLATSLAYFSFYTPIIRLFYLAQDLTIFKIAILGIVWTIVKMFLEVPSSILADKWGRKKVMIISSIFAILQLATILYATEYWHFILVSIWSAASFAFLSGTDIAFFYDTLKVLKKEEQFDKLWARQEIYQQIPLIISFISSGFLYNFSPLLPFQLSLIFLVLSFLVTLTLIEPKYHKPSEEVSVFSHFKQSAQFIFENPYLKSILLFTILFSLGSDLSYGYGQIYLKQLALPIVLFGIAYTFKSLLATVAANFTPSLRRRFSYRGLFGFQIITITLLFYVMVLTKSYLIGAICFILIAIPHGFFGISKSSYMHEHIKSHQRATIESMFSFFIALIFLFVEPITGYLADIYTLKLPFLLVAITMSVYCIYYLFYGHKRI
ncbi:MFS transporter [Candidatus Woesearchaeota archaeon]|nr:MFS transporter [Candidatus Woesearchaeota archaeon]